VGSGGVSYMAFRASKERKDDTGIVEIDAAIERGDFLCVADIIEFVIAPLYKDSTLKPAQNIRPDNIA